MGDPTGPMAEEWARAGGGVAWMQAEHYVPDGTAPPEHTELLTLLHNTGLLYLANLGVLHPHGLALGVRLQPAGDPAIDMPAHDPAREPDVVTGLVVYRTDDPEGVWFDEGTTQKGRQKLLRHGLVLGAKNAEEGTC